ncbi:MAG: hypothetical protein P4L36_22140 [Holophaga sp.]|nr:hypothetical protein [Holophaga sp.]
MAFTKSFAEMVADLNQVLTPHRYSLIEQPDPNGKALLTHPDIDEVVKTRMFLNHGLCGATHSGVLLSLSHKRTELLLESGFKVLLTCHAFEPEMLAQALMKAGLDLLERTRKFIADSNPLHRQLLEHREAITQAGFRLEPTFFIANLETYRELKRVTRERTDLIGVTLDEAGQLVTARLSCAFTTPVPFPVALKVMSLGVAKS